MTHYSPIIPGMEYQMLMEICILYHLMLIIRITRS